jgi:hypothetical protein
VATKARLRQPKAQTLIDTDVNTLFFTFKQRCPFPENGNITYISHALSKYNTTKLTGLEP